MCGIAGFLGSPAGADPEHLLRNMSHALLHRGPDDSGIWLDPHVGIGLAHQRLSIIDLSPAGHQPMLSACGRFVCVFNGEIYNHHELRKKLEHQQSGHDWRGHSDTETLLACFTHWGVEATLQQSSGMFAIALWDKQEQQLYLLRDRLGEKPLYYGWVGDCLAFASELKALYTLPGFQASVDRAALTAYLRFAYVPSPASIYQGIYKLPAGHYLRIPVDTPPRQVLPTRQWWSFNQTARQARLNPIHDEQEALHLLEKHISRAIRWQACADVPLGAFLSGGIDSTTIVALMQSLHDRPVKTFTVGFGQAAYNEADHARQIADYLGTDHTTFQVSARDALDIVPLLPRLYDEPFADTSQIPTYLLCQQARQQVTVALSGDAGDELLGGYSTYLWTQRLWRKTGWLPKPLRNLAGNSLSAIPVQTWNNIAGTGSRLGENLHKLADSLHNTRTMEQLFLALSSHWQDPEQLVLGEQAYPCTWQQGWLDAGNMEAEHVMMLQDSLTGLPDDILCKVDRAAMSNSLETRIPLLDHQVVELAWRLPLSMKIRNGQGKWALRQILYKHVPAELVNRPKQGFNVPLTDWLKGDLRDWAEAQLDLTRLRNEGYLHADKVHKTWRDFLHGRGHHAQRLWNVLMFQAWLEYWQSH